MNQEREREREQVATQLQLFLLCMQNKSEKQTAKERKRERLSNTSLFCCVSHLLALFRYFLFSLVVSFATTC